MKPKPHLEFVKVDLNGGWEQVPGYPKGFSQKILASDIDEKAKRGSRTRLLKIDAGAFTIEPFVHQCRGACEVADGNDLGFHGMAA